MNRGPTQLRPHRYHTPTWSVVLAAALCLTSVGVAAAAPDLTEMSLTDLLDMEVTSVAKKPQPLSHTAAAVYVVTQEELRRSGATTLADALRLVPGVNVAQIDANKWAISARGFNGRFSNKLLVLIDGRSIYTPLFSGVFWDIQDTMLDDIDRIEVIRGPGATVWGANAVNGVINIITKAAAETQGGLLSVGGGTEERGFTAVRYGGALPGRRGHYRIYAKSFDRDTGRDAAGGAAADDWRMVRTGFRVDWTTTGPDMVTLQGDLYDGAAGETVAEPLADPLRVQVIDGDEAVSGGNVLLRWTRMEGGAPALTVQLYYDRATRTSRLFDIVRDTVDVDLQRRTTTGRHDLVWGAGYRHTRDDTSKTLAIALLPTARKYDLWSAFLQDEITVADDLHLTLGTKVEHNAFSGWEVQPGARLLWEATASQTVWASVARAVRTPARADSDTQATTVENVGDPRNPFPVPEVITYAGSDTFDSESVVAYEVGYRARAGAKAAIDIAAFFNDYDQLRSLNGGIPSCEPGGTYPLCGPPISDRAVIPLQFANDLRGESYGVEISGEWQVVDRWRLSATYTYLEIFLHADDPAVVTEDEEERTPHNQATLHSALTLPHHTDLDLWLRYVDNVTDFDIPHYLTADARVAWRPSPAWEVSLVGRNLLDDRHPEFLSELRDISSAEVERSLYGQVRWSF